MPSEQNSDNPTVVPHSKGSPQLSLDDQAYLNARIQELIAQGVLAGVADIRANIELYEKHVRGREGGVISKTLPEKVINIENPSPSLPLSLSHYPLSLFLGRSIPELKMLLREREILDLTHIFRKWKPDRIEEALREYDKCVSGTWQPNNPTAFFVSLL